MKIGVIHGRFQPLHNGHLKEYILPAFKKVDYLFIGIANPDNILTKFDSINPERSKLDSNICTYYERYQMIKNTFLNLGYRNRFDIIPFPINFPKLITNYAPRDAIYFVSIFDEWGEKKLTVLQELGLQTYLLWRKEKREFLSGSEIRQKIYNDEDWELYVPHEVAKVIIENKIDLRIRHLM